jgi:hypothetical protein
MVCGMRIKGWLENVRDRLTPAAYVDWADTPDEPHSPYRARITVPADDGEDEPQVVEREVVRGSCKIIYEIRCQCGRRWFIPRLEHVQTCPRCTRAVLVMAPESGSDD